MGFCFFNNVAIAAAHARTLGAHRVAIVDFDVHHGNGTQHIFGSNPHVLYTSTHQYPFYPGTGAADETGVGAGLGVTVNLPLEAGAVDEDYQIVFAEVALPVLRQFKPDPCWCRPASTPTNAIRSRTCPDLPLPARDLQRALDLPHVRPAGLPLAGRGAQQLGRRAARLRRRLAQQPPRLPSVGPSRAAAMAGRPLLVGDPWPRATPAGLGREGARGRAARAAQGSVGAGRKRESSAATSLAQVLARGSGRAFEPERKAIPCRAPGIRV